MTPTSSLGSDGRRPRVTASICSEAGGEKGSEIANAGCDHGHIMSPEKKIIWQIHPFSPQPPLYAAARRCPRLHRLYRAQLDDGPDGPPEERTHSCEGFLENQGLRIIGVVDRLAIENLKTMIRASQAVQGTSFRPLAEQVLSPQVFLTEKVVEMAREIDDHWKKAHLSRSYIKKYAEDKNLWLVAVLDAWGRLSS